MFDAFSNMGRAALALAATPIDVLADGVTLGGSLTDRAEPYTATRVRQAFESLDRAVSPETRR